MTLLFPVNLTEALNHDDVMTNAEEKRRASWDAMVYASAQARITGTNWYIRMEFGLGNRCTALVVNNIEPETVWADSFSKALPQGGFIHANQSLSCSNNPEVLARFRAAVDAKIAAECAAK